jgi:hypothetical protein
MNINQPTLTAVEVVATVAVAKTQITLITKLDKPSLMSKRISLDAKGEIKSDGSECRMITGTAERAHVTTATALAAIIASCRSDQAIALGALKPDLPKSVSITIPNRLKKKINTITRSRSHIDYIAGATSWCLLDFDTKQMPDEIKARITAAGSMWNALLTVAPDVAKAARVSRASTTTGLFHTGTKELIAGSNGMHHYVLVLDGADIERFLKDLHDRCWLLGFGWHMIGGAGQLLERSIVDRMVGYGERLCFEGQPDIVSPLAQNNSERTPQVFEGDAIRSDLAVPRLSEYERHQIEEAKVKSAVALGKSAGIIRKKHDKELAEKLAAKSGTPVATALRIIKARHRGILYPDVELQLDDASTVTVDAILTDPERYNGETLADPMEGIESYRPKLVTAGIGKAAYRGGA